MESLGGPPTPAVGWAAGIERLAMLVGTTAVEVPELMFIPADDSSRNLAAELLALTRRAGIQADMAFRGSPKKLFDKVKRDLSAARVVSVEARTEPHNFGSIRLRDVWFEAAPIRTRLKKAIASSYVLDDDEATRTISLIRRK